MSFRAWLPSGWRKTGGMANGDRSMLLQPRKLPRNASTLSEARFHESVKLGGVLCARPIEPFAGGRWRLRRMRANGWSR